MTHKQTLELDAGQLAQIRKDNRNPVRRVYWLASYPKSGNTWLRFLLQAWHTGGRIANLNQTTIVKSDLDEVAYQSVLSAPLPYYTDTQLALVRMAAIFAMSTTNGHDRVILKTHNARVKVHDTPMCPGAVSQKAVYVVRDPRDVAISMSAHIGKTIDETIALMANDQATIGFDPMFGKRSPLGHIMCGWSTHARTWLASKDIDIRVIRYEDLQTQTARQLGYMLEAFDYPNDDPKRIVAAVEACHFDSLAAMEDDHGYVESTPHSRFFRVGMTEQWRSVLTTKQVARIQDDHGEMMEQLEYRLE